MCGQAIHRGNNYYPRAERPPMSKSDAINVPKLKVQPTVFDLQEHSSAAKRRQLTCSDDDLAILSAFVRGMPGLQLGKLPPHSPLSIPVLRDTVGFTHGYPLSPHSRLSTAHFPWGQNRNTIACRTLRFSSGRGRLVAGGLCSASTTACSL